MEELVRFQRLKDPLEENCQALIVDAVRSVDMRVVLPLARDRDHDYKPDRGLER